LAGGGIGAGFFQATAIGGKIGAESNLKLDGNFELGEVNFAD